VRFFDLQIVLASTVKSQFCAPCGGGGGGDGVYRRSTRLTVVLLEFEKCRDRAGNKLRLKPHFLASALLRDLSTFAHKLGECKRRGFGLKDFTRLSRRQGCVAGGLFN
jgi:hypothetical protein